MAYFYFYTHQLDVVGHDLRGAGHQHDPLQGKGRGEASNLAVPGDTGGDANNGVGMTVQKKI